MSTTKILMTNETALRAKYGARGWSRVERALQSLAYADGKRGIRTEIVRLDHAADMKRFGARPAKGMGAKAWKVAFDAVVTSASPDYITIVGAGDVFPHQSLQNPLCTAAMAGGDGDENVPSDLPYACTAGYDSNPRAFLAPSRVVARLPDLFGATVPDHLLDLLRVASAATPQPRGNGDYFAVSAKVWRGSTRASLKALFGASKRLALSPAAGPAWTKRRLKARVHFINCHGAPADSQFFGQDGTKYPSAHAASHLVGRVRKGTVVAAECCYGAELYDPALAPPMGICQAYLAAGAYGFLGSTTIAYGPLDAPNASADLVCRFFLESVLQGASLGRALLEARQRFIAVAAPLDPIDLKTVAQFHLLGDASIHAVKQSSAAPHAAHALRGAKKVPTGATSASRRKALREVASSLAATATAATPGGPPASAAIWAALVKASARRGLELGDVSRFVTSERSGGPEPGRALRGGKAVARGTTAPKFYVAFAKANVGDQKSESAPGSQISADLVYIAREVDGEIRVRELQQKRRGPTALDQASDLRRMIVREAGRGTG